MRHYFSRVRCTWCLSDEVKYVAAEENTDKETKHKANKVFSHIYETNRKAAQMTITKLFENRT